MTRHTRRVAKIINSVNLFDDLVLDIGAGYSPYRKFLKGNVIGVDLKLTKFVDLLASVEQLPFPNAIFNGITCFQVLYYLSDPNMAITELVRVLRPGGWIAMSVSRLSALRVEKKPCCSWTGRDWDNAFIKRGLIRETPFKECFIFRYIGAYHFGLFVKKMD